MELEKAKICKQLSRGIGRGRDKGGAEQENICKRGSRGRAREAERGRQSGGWEQGGQKERIIASKRQEGEGGVGTGRDENKRTFASTGREGARRVGTGGGQKQTRFANKDEEGERGVGTGGKYVNGRRYKAARKQYKTPPGRPGKRQKNRKREQAGKTLPGPLSGPHLGANLCSFWNRFGACLGFFGVFSIQLLG